MNIKISKEEIRDVIRRVLTYYMRKPKLDRAVGKTLFLVPKIPVELGKSLSELELYGELDTIEIFMEEKNTDETASDITGNRFFCQENKEDVRHVTSSLGSYRKLEVYAPSINFLKKIKEGVEDELFIRITLFFLMTGKPVIFREPYDSKSLPDGKFGKAMRDLMEDMWDMGISFAGLTPGLGELADIVEEEKPDVVTEEMVEKYYSMGYRQIPAAKHAVVTPLAREKAKELDIQILV